MHRQCTFDVRIHATTALKPYQFIYFIHSFIFIFIFIRFVIWFFIIEIVVRLFVCVLFSLLFFLHVLDTFFVFGAGWIFAGSALAKIHTKRESYGREREWGMMRMQKEETEQPTSWLNHQMNSNGKHRKSLFEANRCCCCCCCRWLWKQNILPVFDSLSLSLSMYLLQDIWVCFVVISCMNIYVLFSCDTNKMWNEKRIRCEQRNQRTNRHITIKATDKKCFVAHKLCIYQIDR